MKVYDLYAAAALQALIAKAPLIDREGEHGKELTEEKFIQFKKDMAGSAHEYAAHMMNERAKFAQWIDMETGPLPKKS